MSAPQPEKIRILLITNRDSDNVGDQVIEACDIALIKTALNNLGISEGCVTISSRALGLVNTNYIKTRNKTLLKSLEKEIETSSFVLFGGAPIFNYKYQDFYLKTLTILSIAKQMNKPVMFSAIGIDSYEENNERCQALKNELHNGVVQQITTRDGIDYLRKYCPKDSSGHDITIDLVSDPAVFSHVVFSRHSLLTTETLASFSSQAYRSIRSKAAKLIKGFVNRRKDDEGVRTGKAKPAKPKIGIFVFRAGGFSANNLKFSRAQQCNLWKDLCSKLEDKGYDYELLTSGHFADEALLQYMIDNDYIAGTKCKRHTNIPEDLVGKIGSYDAVISCRLHPSIISFSCNVPSIGLIWNSKVTDFYKHIGYPERAIEITDLFSDGKVCADKLISSLETAMHQGVKKDSEYIDSVYLSMVKGIASCLRISFDPNLVWRNNILIDKLSRYEGTRIKDEREKVERKLTRCYRNYNDAQTQLTELRSSISDTFSMIYHSGSKNATANDAANDFQRDRVEKLASGNIQYHFPERLTNNGREILPFSFFSLNNRKFEGWRIRFRIDSSWYWIYKDGGFILKSNEQVTLRNSDNARVFKAGEVIPFLPVRKIDVMVAEAVWGKDELS